MTELISTDEVLLETVDPSDDVANATTRRSIETASGRGDSSKALTNTHMGFNHRMTPNHTPKNKETQGMTFYTRPDFNLSYAQMLKSPRFKDLMESDHASDNYAIIAALDPESELTLIPGATGMGAPLKPGIPFDNRQAFIPLLTNNTLSLTGFPDNTLDIFVSEEGIQREQWMMVDSSYEINGSYTLSASFRNIEGDPITTLFTTWLEWMAGSYDGTFVPKARNGYEREIEYETRIYRLLMTPDKRFLTKIGATFVSIPVNDNLGAAMNFNSQEVFNNEADNINIQFACIGARYKDPDLIGDFNYTVMTFNPDMVPMDANDDDYIPVGKDFMRMLTRSEILAFNYYGYPRINPATKEIQWWIYNDEYDRILSTLI